VLKDDRLSEGPEGFHIEGNNQAGRSLERMAAIEPAGPDLSITTAA